MGGTMNKEVNDSIRFCLPDKLKVRALLEAVIEYLDANNIPPSAPFKEEVVLALRKIWPCKG